MVSRADLEVFVFHLIATTRDREEDRLFLGFGRVCTDRDGQLEFTIAIVFDQACPFDRVADMTVVVVERDRDAVVLGDCHRV